VFAGVSALSLLMLDKSCRITSATSYSELGRLVFAGDGKEASTKFANRISTTVDVLQSLYSYGACVGYLCIVVNELVLVTSYSQRLPLLLCALVIVYPLSLMKSMKSLSFTSMCAIICVMYLSVVIAIRAPWSDGVCSSGTAPVDEFVFSGSLGTSLPIFCFAFNCQVQFIPIVRELSDATASRVRSLVLGSMFFVLVLYSLDAGMGYLTFCQDTLNNILDCYSEDDVLVTISQWAFTLILSFSFPLYSTAIATAADNIIGGEGQGSNPRRFALVTAIIGSMAVITLFNPSLDAVLGLTGAIGGCALVYVFPGIFYHKALIMQGEEKGSPAGLLLAGVGFILGITCSVVIIAIPN
jgi:amino acid permease